MPRPSFRPPVSSEIYLRHQKVDDALYALDQYLDDAFMAGWRQVRVVHGKGGGTLRQAVRDWLGRHPLVRSFRAGGYGEGGDGVTIVDLVGRNK